MCPRCSARHYGLTAKLLANSRTLYAGTYGGVFESTNGGTSWTAVNSGLTATTYVFALAIDPSTPVTLYAGTYGGVFKSTNGGASWTVVNSGLTTTYVPALTLGKISAGSRWVAATTGQRLLNRSVFLSKDWGPH